MTDVSPSEMLDIFYSAEDRVHYCPFVFIPEQYVINLCNLVKSIFLSETTVLRLQTPINVCGDTHGQFIDTLRIFKTIGRPGDCKYVFMGDYVDRGPQSIENLLFLLTLKAVYPDKIFLTRGNHETEDISTTYGFRDEALRRYGFAVYSEIISVFECMPLATTINDCILCVHGGITQPVGDEWFGVDDLDKVVRPLEEIGETDPVNDFLWSDPCREAKGFEKSPRGVSHKFDNEKLEEFCRLNNLKLILRSHEFCEEGVRFPFGEGTKIATVFSASNYERTANQSAVCSIDNDLKLHFTVFKPII